MAGSIKAGSPTPRAAGLRRILLRALAVSGVALATANCSSNTQKFASAPAGNGLDPKYGVKASPRLYNEGDVIPKGGGRRFSGKPYVVAGRTYVPREDARGYVREGLASWYGSAFHGRMTANGEVFDRHSIAAAHPTLPLPSYARVTNLANGRSMIVRVNDRGPYHADRVMDVSEAVAEALEFHRRGTSRVRVEYAGKASVAGSDDRKLMATLRTDGQPAAMGARAPVMLADLGSDAADPAPDSLARARAPLAFRPAEEEAPAPRPARPAPILVASAVAAVPAALQPTAARGGAFRPAPVSSTVPAPAPAPMAPAPMAPAPLAAAGRPPAGAHGAGTRLAGLNPGSLPKAALQGRGAAAGPLRLAANPAANPAAGPGRAGAALAAVSPPRPAPGRTPAGRDAAPKLAAAAGPQKAASAGAPMPAAAKNAMARLAAAPQAAPAKATPAKAASAKAGPATVKAAAGGSAKPAPRRAQVAGVY
ncbi:septal ring lytic transglycosylase RlpA family protein [Methylobacterium sp. A54F]